MITKYRDGKMPSGKITEANYIQARRAGIDPDGQEIVSVVEHARDEFLRRFDNFEFSHGLEVLWTVIARIDKMISDAKPWELVKGRKTGRDAECRTLSSDGNIAMAVRSASSGDAGCVKKDLCADWASTGDIASVDPASLKWGEIAPGTRRSDKAREYFHELIRKKL